MAKNARYAELTRPVLPTTLAAASRSINTRSPRTNFYVSLRTQRGSCRHGTHSFHSRQTGRQLQRSPWSTGTFALAHNGVLWNDENSAERKIFRIPTFQTDSLCGCAAARTTENPGLHEPSARWQKRKSRRSFITVLDRDDNLYFVRGDNPLAIFNFGGFYLYASTEEILRRAMRKLRLHHQEAVNTGGGYLED